MKATFAYSLCLATLVMGCSKSSENDQPNQDSRAEKPSSRDSSGVGPSQGNADGAEVGKAEDDAKPALTNAQLTKLKWDDLQSPRAQAGMSPPQVASVADGEKENLEPQVKSFTRLEGADGGFCGATKAGPLECWGANAELHRGAFVDVAVAGTLACGATSGGKIECPGTKLNFPMTKIKRISGAGDNFCALDFNSTAHCFSTSGEPALTAPEGLRVAYLDVGGGFACAANKDKELVCWGDTDKLSLPSLPTKIRDLAAGDDFVCVIRDDKGVACFGEGPALSGGKYKGIAAGYGTLCAVPESGTSKCVGTVDETFDGDVKRLAVGKASVCALSATGHPQCKGADSYAQLTPPAETEPSIAKGLGRKVSKEKFTDFLSRFPEAELPLDLTEKGVFPVGDRIPLEFTELLGDDANSYRSGVRIPLEGGAVAVTLLNHGTGVYGLRTFRKDGTPVRARSLAKYERQGEPENGEVSTSRSTVRAGGLIESSSHKGTVETHYVKEHLDGSRPVSKIVCSISGTEWTDKITAGGDLKRQDAKVLPTQNSVDRVGCRGTWPF